MDGNLLLETSRGKKEGNARRNEAVQSNFETQLAAATCPLHRPINRGGGWKPAAAARLWPEQHQAPETKRPEPLWAKLTLCSHQDIHAGSQSGDKAATRPVSGDSSPC